MDLPAGMRPCCISGTVATGTPVGSITQIGGVDCYVSKPAAWKGKEGRELPQAPAVMIFPDVFGIQFVNTQLVADQLAAEGFLAVIVDIIQGDPMPASAMENMLELARPDLKRPAGDNPSPLESLVAEPVRKAGAVGNLLSTFPGFLLRQVGADGVPPKNQKMLPTIDTVLHNLRSGSLGPVGKVGAVGFCFGGSFAFMVGGLRDKPPQANGTGPGATVEDGLVDAFVVAHTQVTVPDFITPLKRPGLFIAASNDFAFPDAEIGKAAALFKELEGKGQGPFKVVQYPGTYHGFMTRGDDKNEVIQKAKADGTRLMIDWFKTYLR